MPISRLRKEKIRLSKEIFDELLEYHFENALWEHGDNAIRWHTLLENNIQPHTDILCDFSNRLIKHGWSKETVEEVFFVATTKDIRQNNQATNPSDIRKIFSWFKKFIP